MKTVETKLYFFDELSEEAQEKVIEKEKERVYNDPCCPSLEEGMDSLHAIAKELGFKLRDWPQIPGNSISDAAAVKLGKIIEDEIDYQTTKEAIMENMDLDEEIYTKDGEIFSITD